MRKKSVYLLILSLFPAEEKTQTEPSWLQDCGSAGVSITDTPADSSAASVLTQANIILNRSSSFTKIIM